ncbi:UNVERIFIED_CONTAM: Zinc finger protein CONSTANS-LIKE 5 [Sesamum radiatum]|uniref:Zinc finger protein CONSTANS-LIKE 5 n=1 Tax=Sesamum radiatum TaxID=300843 RepID=A0AAW2NR53_SESRA
MGISHDGAGVARPPKSFTPGWNAAAKPCDYCSSAAALLFCHAHSAFMCMACDSKVHASDDKHERVWMCEVCEHAPAAVTCKADAAALCVSCDRDILRQPPRPSPRACCGGSLLRDRRIHVDDPYGGDSVVPVQPTIKPPVPVQSTHQHSPENRFEIDFTRSRIASYNSNYTTPSLSHSVSSSSMDVGIVPEGSSMSEISYSFPRTMSTSSFDLSANTGSQPAGLDREARAYAETRPRIKGRFAKRSDSESDIDGIFSSGGGSLFADARYGVVPSF